MKYKASSAVYTGTRHQRDDILCQDCVRINRDLPILACALADGAGSRANSRQGAECVVQTVTELLEQDFDQFYTMKSSEITQIIVQNCYQALSQLEPPIYEMACTLLFCAFHEDGRFLAGHLGDGVMILEQAGELSVFSAPENGEYQNETYFITGTQAEEHLRIQRGNVNTPGTLFLMSDGTADSLYDYATGTPAIACRTLAVWLRDGEAAVIDQALAKNMEKRLSHHTSDDMSLILVSWQ